MNARPFSFGADFKSSRSDSASHRAEIGAIEAAARAAGYEAGRREAEMALEGQLAVAAERIGAMVPALTADIEMRLAAIEGDSLGVAFKVARALAGEALAAQPLAAVAEVAAEAFAHLRGVPHLAIRVHDDLVEGVEQITSRMARERGFEGRVIVLGDPEIEPGDVRVEWADGGVLRERRQLEEQVARIHAELGLGRIHSPQRTS